MIEKELMDKRYTEITELKKTISTLYLILCGFWLFMVMALVVVLSQIRDAIEALK